MLFVFCCLLKASIWGHNKHTGVNCSVYCVLVIWFEQRKVIPLPPSLILFSFVFLNCHFNLCCVVVFIYYSTDYCIMVSQRLLYWNDIPQKQTPRPLNPEKAWKYRSDNNNSHMRTPYVQLSPQLKLYIFLLSSCSFISGNFIIRVNFLPREDNKNIIRRWHDTPTIVPASSSPSLSDRHAQKVLEAGQSPPCCWQNTWTAARSPAARKD